MKLEASLGTGDPKFPKIIWPPKQLCSSCYCSSSWMSNGTSQVDWDLDKVYNFLVDYYGRTLVSLYEGKNSPGNVAADISLEEIGGSTNAVAVPVGAALAIAVASCAFGALACYWRSQQKSRKYFHNLHSYKNI